MKYQDDFQELGIQNNTLNHRLKGTSLSMFFQSDHLSLLLSLTPMQQLCLLTFFTFKKKKRNLKLIAFNR